MPTRAATFLRSASILYEMLTGKPAFRKATSADTLSAILNEDPPAVSQVATSVLPGLQRIVNRCLAKNPAQRLQHASDLEFALESLSDSSSSTVAGVHEAAPSKRWIWLAATAAFVIATATALTVWWRQPPAVPVVEAVTQLTDDGEPKLIYDNLLTDGSRIYFNEGTNSSLKVAQVAVIGGPTAIIPVKLAAPIIVDLSHEGASLLTVVGPTPGRVYFLCGRYCYPRENCGASETSKLSMQALRQKGASFSLVRRSSTLPTRMAQILASC